MESDFDPALLPVPYDALIELGMDDAEIRRAWESRPLISANQLADHPGAYFDVGAARRAIRAIESFKHTKGRWGGSPLILAPWQRVWIVAPVFGWRFHDPELGCSVRVARSVWVEVPRKAGKAPCRRASRSRFCWQTGRSAPRSTRPPAALIKRSACSTTRNEWLSRRRPCEAGPRS